MYKNLLEAIGNTPLVQVNFDSPAKIYAKLEYLNPGGINDVQISIANPSMEDAVNGITGQKPNRDFSIQHTGFGYSCR